jgi:hypothetical protein
MERSKKKEGRKGGRKEGNFPSEASSPDNKLHVRFDIFSYACFLSLNV